MSPADYQTEIFAAGPEKRLATTNIAPPNACYVSQDDTLYLFFVPSVTGAVIRTLIRLLSPEGDIKIMEYDYTTVGTRSPQVMTANLGEGFILSVNVYCLTTSLQRGQVYARFMFLRGNITQAYLGQVLCQGYVTTNSSQFFPFGQNEGSTGGRGAFRSITGSTPGVAAEISETVPSGALWRICSIRYSLTSSATVASRGSMLVVDDGTNAFGTYVPAASQTAGQTVIYTWGAGVPLGNISLSVFSMAFPNDLFLFAGSRFRTSTVLMQAGDQYTAPQYLVEEWMYP